MRPAIYPAFSRNVTSFKNASILKKDPGLLRARDIMTPKENIVVAAEEDDIQNLMNTMTEKRIRHLPIFRGQELSGIISIGDIVKSMIEIKDYEIKSLIDYISGNYPR